MGVLKPKNIIQDKEKLYEDNVNLKNIINLLREENNKLKSKNNCMERDLNKYEKMVENQVLTNQNNKKTANEVILSNSIIKEYSIIQSKAAIEIG